VVIELDLVSVNDAGRRLRQHRLVRVARVKITGVMSSLPRHDPPVMATLSSKASPSRKRTIGSSQWKMPST
jgi:hypothetical protein